MTYNNRNVCPYGLKCCPGEGGKCVYKYEQECSCEYSDCPPDEYSGCYEVLVVDCVLDRTVENCSSVCPELPANTNDVCYSDAPHYSCIYNYPLVKDEPGFAVHTKECVCTLGKFVCSCSENECPTQCPQSPLVQEAECSAFDGGYCNYTQPCCVQGGEGTCVANSTCFCDEPTGSVNCTTLPIQFCTSGTDSTRGGSKNRGQMIVKKKKKLRNNMSKMKPMLSRKLVTSGHG